MRGGERASWKGSWCRGLWPEEDIGAGRFVREHAVACDGIASLGGPIAGSGHPIASIDSQWDAKASAATAHGKRQVAYHNGAFEMAK